MAMQVGGGGEDGVMIDINTTPLIDVMLVLIIMLIITIPVQLHAVNLNLPQGKPPPPNKPPPPPAIITACSPASTARSAASAKNFKHASSPKTPSSSSPQTMASPSAIAGWPTNGTCGKKTSASPPSSSIRASPLPTAAAP